MKQLGLDAHVRKVASQQQVVPRNYHPGEPCKHARVNEQSYLWITHSHVPRNLFRRLVHVHHACHYKSPVKHWTPEVGGFGACR